MIIGMTKTSLISAVNLIDVSEEAILRVTGYCFIFNPLINSYFSYNYLKHSTYRLYRQPMSAISSQHCLEFVEIGFLVFINSCQHYRVAD